MTRKIRLKKISLLLAVLFLTLTPVAAFAMSYHDGTITIPQGTQYKYTSEMGLDGGSIHFLSDASASNVYLNETTYTVYLEEKGFLGIWTTKNSIALPNNSNSSVTFTNNSAGVYRFKLYRPRYDSGQITVYYQVMN